MSESEWSNLMNVFSSAACRWKVDRSTCVRL